MKRNRKTAPREVAHVLAEYKGNGRIYVWCEMTFGGGHALTSDGVVTCLRCLWDQDPRNSYGWAVVGAGRIK